MAGTTITGRKSSEEKIFKEPKKRARPPRKKTNDTREVARKNRKEVKEAFNAEPKRSGRTSQGKNKVDASETVSKNLKKEEEENSSHEPTKRGRPFKRSDKMNANEVIEQSSSHLNNCNSNDVAHNIEDLIQTEHQVNRNDENVPEDIEEVDLLIYSSDSSSVDDSDDDFEKEITKLKPRVKRVKKERVKKEEKPKITTTDARKKKETKCKIEKEKGPSVGNKVHAQVTVDVEVKRRKRKTKAPGEPKRRRIKRSNVSLTDQFTCGTFVSFIPIVEDLTTEIHSDDEVDNERLEQVKKYLKDSAENTSISMGPENYELDQNNALNDEETLKRIVELRKRNQVESISQAKNLNVSLFAEKLCGYDSHLTLYGSSRSLIRSYHPDMLKSSEYLNIPSFIMWKRQFSHLVHVKSQFDIDEETKRYVSASVKSKENERKDEMIASIRQRAAIIYEANRLKRKRDGPTTVNEIEEPIFNVEPPVNHHHEPEVEDYDWKDLLFFQP